MTRKLLYTTAVVLLPIGIALASGPPQGKEGLWSVNRQMIDNPGNKKDVFPPIKLCRNRAYDQYVMGLAKNMHGCTTVSESTQGNKYFVELKCVVGKTVIDTKGTTTFQGDTSGHSESHTTYIPPMFGKSESTMIIDSKYIGSCPAGMQPGDRINGDGTIAHGWKH
jgi:hypothetical protein